MGLVDSAWDEDEIGGVRYEICAWGRVSISCKRLGCLNVSMYLIVRMPLLKSRVRRCSCSRVNCLDSFDLKKASRFEVPFAASNDCYST